MSGGVLFTYKNTATERLQCFYRILFDLRINRILLVFRYQMLTQTLLNRMLKHRKECAENEIHECGLAVKEHGFIGYSRYLLRSHENLLNRQN